MTPFIQTLFKEFLNPFPPFKKEGSREKEILWSECHNKTNTFKRDFQRKIFLPWLRLKRKLHMVLSYTFPRLSASSCDIN